MDKAKLSDEYHYQSLLRETSQVLKAKFPNMTPRILDHQIWRRMSLGE